MTLSYPRALLLALASLTALAAAWLGYGLDNRWWAE